MSLWRWDFEASCAQAMSLLSTDQDVAHLSPLAPHLPVCCHASHHEANGLIVRKCKPAAINC